MKKPFLLFIAAALCLSLCSCGTSPEPETEPVDYSRAILGFWYAVEYESEYVEFREDGTVMDCFGSSVTYGEYLVDNENALIWVNFGDDFFAMGIGELDGKMVLLDNNGTLVREEDAEAARAEYRAMKEKK